MSEYRDHIPDRAFLVAPDYEVRTATVDGVDYSRVYFKRYKAYRYTSLYTIAKYHLTSSAVTQILDTTPEYDENTAYQMGETVRIADICVIYEAGSDVPAGNHPLDPNSVDESGVPYWVEKDTVEEWKPFDASIKTEISAPAGIYFTGQAYFLPSSIYGGSWNPYTVTHISMMGIRADVGADVRIFVQFYWKDYMDAVSAFETDVNRCNYYNAALIDSFEIDASRRDRISFALPDFHQFSKPTPPDVVGENISFYFDATRLVYFDVFVESRVQKPIPTQVIEPCGGQDASMYDASGNLSVGLFMTGTRYDLGLTEFGMKLGRSTTQSDETNYLARRTVKKAVETIELQISVQDEDEHMNADYFFRIASETSHIIHPGTPDFDWRFAFGIIDGNLPIDHPNVNFMSVTGTGIAFFATDPLITQNQITGWR